MNLELICSKVCDLARSTGMFIRAEAIKINHKNIEVKGLNNFVTYVDKVSESQLVDGLKKILPEAGFITEEGTATENGSDYRWVIDPLDGTTNFIHGLPPYAISIGLMYKEEVVIGVIYEISAGECFYAWKGSNAYLDGNTIKVTEASNVSDSLIATGFPYYDFNQIKPFMKTLEYLFVNSHGVRRLGSAATDLAYVACGRFEVFYEYNLNSWDVAAGSLIVKQAGGQVTDFKGGNNFIFGKEIIASNTNVYSDFKRVIDSNFTL
jgi:myo-inositol-1(or 4)-monophosphatase